MQARTMPKERKESSSTRSSLVSHRSEGEMGTRESVSWDAESFMTIPSRYLDNELFPTIECVFVNKRSGAKHGSAFLDVLNDLEGVHCQVHDLATEDPDELIENYINDWASRSRSNSYRNSPQISIKSSANSGDSARNLEQKSFASFGQLPVIMACGGDGTFSWIASTALKHAHNLLSTPKTEDENHMKVAYCVIPFPLGTGNDMSGVLGWGRTLSPSPMKARKLVESVEQASIGPKCDVWGVSFKKFESMARFNTMCNYFSIGADAKASRLFENHRSSRPKLYRSQSFNKASYAAFGGFLALKGSSSIGKRIKHLIVDGKEVPVPQNAKALIVLNIPSYADGTKPWDVGKNHPHFKEAAIDDGMVEVFCLKSILSIALLKTLRGVFSGGVSKLAQGSKISIQMHPMEVWATKKQGVPKSKLYGQVDGESFEFGCDGEVIDIHRKGSVPTMFGPYRGKAQQGPPAKLIQGSFNARWPRSPSEQELASPK